jgi:hypothetical protein
MLLQGMGYEQLGAYHQQGEDGQQMGVYVGMDGLPVNMGTQQVMQYHQGGQS